MSSSSSTCLLKSNLISFTFFYLPFLKEEEHPVGSLMISLVLSNDRTSYRMTNEPMLIADMSKQLIGISILFIPEDANVDSSTITKKDSSTPQKVPPSELTSKSKQIIPSKNSRRVILNSPSLTDCSCPFFIPLHFLEKFSHSFFYVLTPQEQSLI